MYANLVVILNWDTSMHSVPEHSQIEEYMIDYFGKGGAKMNPGAMFGRFSAVAMESTPDFDPLSVKLLCGGDVASSSMSNMDGSNSFVVLILALVAVALIFCLTCQSDAGVASPGTKTTTSTDIRTLESEKKPSAEFDSSPRR